MEKENKETEKRIKELENLIKGMKEDEDFFGLVSEYREKLNKWIIELQKINREENKKNG